MWRLKSVKRRDLGTLVEGLMVADMDVVSERELLQVEGGRARVGNVLDEATRRLPTSEVRVELPGG